MANTLIPGRSSALAAISLFAVALVFTTPAEGAIVTYGRAFYGSAEGTNGAAGARLKTEGEGPRIWNRVYHADGYYWGVQYRDNYGNFTSMVICSGSPCVDNRDHSYASSWCEYWDAASVGGQWTCRTD